MSALDDHARRNRWSVNLIALLAAVAPCATGAMPAASAQTIAWDLGCAQDVTCQNKDWGASNPHTFTALG